MTRLATALALAVVLVAPSMAAAQASLKNPASLNEKAPATYKVKLDSGPEGMKVAADGTVSWAVPANFADTAVTVILTISDASGQETFHTFTLPVATRP